MAAPITHIVLTDKIFQQFFLDKNKTVFFIGTSFPDIRYLGVIDRDKSHFDNIYLKDLNKYSSFEAGLKFHSLLDQKREEYIVASGIYSHFPNSPITAMAIKFYEDQTLYDRFDQWNEVINYFNEVIDQEKSFGIEDTDTRKWHSLLQRYFAHKPDAESIYDFVQTIGRPKELADEILALTDQMEDNPDIARVVNNLYNQFESLITK